MLIIKGRQPVSFIGASVSYLNGTANWLNSIADADGANPFNWILSGNNKTAVAKMLITSKDNSVWLKLFMILKNSLEISWVELGRHIL